MRVESRLAERKLPAKYVTPTLRRKLMACASFEEMDKLIWQRKEALAKLYDPIAEATKRERMIVTRKPPTPTTPEEVRLAIANETEQPLMMLSEWEITGDKHLRVLKQEAACNPDNSGQLSPVDKIYLDADRRQRQAELEMLAIRTGRDSWLETQIKDQPLKDRAFARLRWRQIRLDQEIDGHLHILERLIGQSKKTAEKLALLAQDPTINTRATVRSALKKYKRLIPLPPNSDKIDRAVYDFGSPCQVCFKPFRMTIHKGVLQRYCSDACKMKAYRQRKRLLPERNANKQ